MPMHVELVSPEEIVFSGDADMVIVRTTDGEIAFQPGHVPFVGVLAVAQARVYLVDGGVQRMAVHRGFAEVSHDRVTILSDMAELGEHIDEARADRAREAAEERLKTDAADDEAAVALERALIRLETAEAHRTG